MCIWNRSSVEGPSACEGANADEQETFSMGSFVLEPEEFIGQPLHEAAPCLALL